MPANARLLAFALAVHDVAHAQALAADFDAFLRGFDAQEAPAQDGADAERLEREREMTSGAGDTRVSIPFGLYVATASVVRPGGATQRLVIGEGLGAPEAAS